MTATLTLGDLTIDDHELTVPLVWGDPQDPRTIEIFARVVTRRGGEDLPYLVFLQGGPGHEAPRPSLSPAGPSWIEAALEHHRLVLLDQRGTGRSTPVSDDDLTPGTDAVAERLTHLRADSIVEDCEAVRQHLGSSTWSVLGQSFGGFTLVAYLSRHPQSVQFAYFTGGLTAVGRPPEDVYALCYDKLRAASLRYWQRFPADRDRMRRLLDACAAGEVVLPSSEVVSVSRVRSLGVLLGSNDGWLTLHHLLDLPLRSNALRHDLAEALPFSARNPLYYVIHESSYADGSATRWAAERTRPADFDDDVTLLTGEHVDREWSRTVPELRAWRAVAETLAERPWPKLYDADALRSADIRGAAAVYVNDLYVPLEYSLQTAELMPGVVPYVTSGHEHNGLRASGGEVLRHLIDLAHGRAVR